MKYRKDVCWEPVYYEEKITDAMDARTGNSVGFEGLAQGSPNFTRQLMAWTRYRG